MCCKCMTQTPTFQSLTPGQHSGLQKGDKKDRRWGGGKNRHLLIVYKTTLFPTRFPRSKKVSHVEFSQYFIGLSKQDLVLHVVDANSTSMISSGVNLQCVPGFGYPSTHIACVTAIEVDLAVSPHQGWVHHNFRAVEAPPLRVLQSLHHWVQHRI